ncbi:hypothetical protein ACIBI8_19420 [Streptomyces sp. NPDC050529]|uniref:hypothetical protein n=1 Tax=unclassified Streptomyces TaxID=2593676 RepID=UPI002DD9DA70|nr:hypothetical protein [Streptomyces sp. NBC_01022]WRZ82075.1 hypothetical protein OG316_18305 [Streptomyces sp. NBC_01022]
MRTKRRIGTFLAASSLFVGVGLTFGANSASADPTFTFKKFDNAGNGPIIAVYNDGHSAGAGYWHKDPVSYYPGDSIQAVDSYSDGWAVETILYDPYHTTSTSGHPAPYAGPYKTYNLPEGTSVKIRVCATKGLNATCSSYYSSTA